MEIRFKIGRCGFAAAAEAAIVSGGVGGGERGKCDSGREGDNPAKSAEKYCLGAGEAGLEVIRELWPEVELERLKRYYGVNCD